MADWGTPGVGSAYADVITQLKARDVDAATQFYGGAPTNPVLNMIRFVAANNRWERYNGTSWVEVSSAYQFGTLTIAASGNIGIGTTAPGRALHLKSTAVGLRIEGTTSGGFLEIVGPSNTNFIGTPASVAGGSAVDLAFYVSGTESVRMDTAGNVGVGVVPSAWAGYKALQVGRAALFSSGADAYLTKNVYYGSGGPKLIADGVALLYAAEGSAHRWYASASGLAGDTAALVTKMELDGSGNLTVTGTASATTPATADNSTKLATTAFVRAQGYATLASPTFTGVPAAPTAAADTNTTQLATTAFVIAQAYAKLASPALTGTPTAPTAAVNTNTTQIATTAFVVGQGYAKLASPALTGTPTAPTPATADNSTTVATTAFVKAQGYATTSDLAAYAPLTPAAGTIGSYAMCRVTTGGTITFGATVAGSNLRPVDTSGGNSGSTLSGTWRCMGQAFSGAGNVEATTLFLRIS